MVVAHTRRWTRVVIDPVDDAVLAFDSHERHIPTGSEEAAPLPAAHLRMRLRAAGPPADIDHITRFKHDGRTRHDNLQILCRASHIAKDAGFADVRMGAEGVPLWRKHLGGVQKMQTGMRIKAVALPEDAPF